MSKSSSISEVLHNPGFTNLWINQILVQLSYNSLNFALLVWVFKLTSSTTAVSALMMAIYLPAVLFGILSGVFVDIIDRRKIIAVINLLMSASFLGLFLYKDYYFAILGFTFLINSMGTFYLASEASAIPIVVKKDQLLMSNSIFSTTVFLTFLCGFGLSGPLISMFGVSFIFAMGAVALFIGFLLTFTMPKIVSTLDEEALMLQQAISSLDLKKFWRIVFIEIKKTFSIIKGHPQVLAAILIISLEQSIVGILGVIIPSFFENVLRINAADASLILVLPLGVGMILGAYLIGRMGHNLPKRYLVRSGISIAGILMFLLGSGQIITPLSYRFHATLPFFYRPSHSTTLALGAFLLGLALVSVLVPSQTVLQEKTPESTRGKVFAVLSTCMSAFALVPILLSGALTDLFGPSTIILIIGLILFSLGALVSSPRLFFKEILPRSWRGFIG